MELLKILKAISQEMRKIEAKGYRLDDKTHEGRVAMAFYIYLSSAFSYIHHRIVKEKYNVQCASFAMDKWSAVSDEAHNITGIDSDHSMEPEGLCVWVNGEKKIFPCYDTEDCINRGFHDWDEQVKL